jgi:hypothetical protein
MHYPAHSATDSFDDLFVEGPAAEAWATRTTQPLAALARPADAHDARVPVVDLVAYDDLDAVATGLAAVEVEPVFATRSRTRS